MHSIISSEQMKRLDSRATNEYGIPAIVLMENAGKACADYLRDTYSNLLNNGVVILCGPGNNGGDGYVIARWLNYYGYHVYIIPVGEGTSSPEAIANKEACQKQKRINFIHWKNDGDDFFVKTVLKGSGIIIDAIYGIGFKGDMPDDVADLMEEVNDSYAFKVAIDIPSGINADTGYGVMTFISDITLTMESRKFGLIVGWGKMCCGEVIVIPIGIPRELWLDESYAIAVDESIINEPFRDPDSQKGDFGKVAVFAGSPGYTGAAFMASTAALKAGAGLVTIFCNPQDFQYYINKPYEVMVKTTPVNDDGTINTSELETLLSSTDVILFGPGCGINDYTLKLLMFISENWNKPAVIDADGLNVLAVHPEILSKLADKPFVLTPHWGEFCRLANTTKDALEADCLSVLKEYVNSHKLKVLLKNSSSIFYDSKSMLINTYGNDGLATGGSGDVLAGLISGFMAQKIDPPTSSATAAYYLGVTAENLAKVQHTCSITPTDILNNLFKYNNMIEDDDD